MNLTWIDWTLMVVAVIGLRAVSLNARKYMQGVADFLSANRLAGRYLLTISSQMGGIGVISFVAVFEMVTKAGFVPLWWSLMGIPVGVIILLTGWVYYRFRETRAFTLAQFFEMRYSRKYRIFAGFLVFATGALNFGIFPAVAARFFIYFCGLPNDFMIPGIPLHIATFPVVMAVDLLLALTFVNMGGQISVMVTECVQGIFTLFAFLVILGFVLLTFHWSDINTALTAASTGPNASLIHPFHTTGVKDFDLWYFLIGMYATFYGYMAWQGSSGFNSAARTPHEQKMGGVIGGWRQIPQGMIQYLLPVAVLVVLLVPAFSGKAGQITHVLVNIDNPTIADQMRVPVALAHILPAGIKGLLAVSFLFFSFTCHDTYMHSWGSIFIQDVVMPFRKKPLAPAQHIKMLRWAITGVAIFAFFFSLIYQQSTQILMFFAITGTIWLGGAGAVIIGGLYTRWGTTVGAYSASITGAVIGVAGLFVPDYYKAHFHHEFPITGQVLWFFAMVTAALVYVIVSLLTTRKTRYFNLDRMLHRGQYMDAEKLEMLRQEKKVSIWSKLIGITEEFTRSDKVLAIILVAWNFFWFVFFLIVTTMNIIHPFSDAWWMGYWKIYITANVCMTLPIAIWFAIGGTIDIRLLYQGLKKLVRDDTDNGHVVHYDDDVTTAKEQR